MSTIHLRLSAGAKTPPFFVLIYNVCRRAVDALGGCDAATATDVNHPAPTRAPSQLFTAFQILLVLLMAVGPSTGSWPRAVEVMADKRADSVVVSLLHRFCQKQLQCHQQHMQLGLIALYTLSSFYIEAPKRLLRNFIEEGGVALLAATVKMLVVDAAAYPSSGISADDVFRIVWALAVNVMCVPSFEAILSPKPPGGDDCGFTFSVVDSFSDNIDHLSKQRFSNQELLPVRFPNRYASSFNNTALRFCCA